jgi:hypothetical protein
MDADAGGTVTLAEFRAAVKLQQLRRAWPPLLELEEALDHGRGNAWPAKVAQAFTAGLAASASASTTLSAHEEGAALGLDPDQLQQGLAEMDVR